MISAKYALIIGSRVETHYQDQKSYADEGVLFMDNSAQFIRRHRRAFSYCSVSCSYETVRNNLVDIFVQINESFEAISLSRFRLPPTSLCLLEGLCHSWAERSRETNEQSKIKRQVTVTVTKIESTCSDCFWILGMATRQRATRELCRRTKSRDIGNVQSSILMTTKLICWQDGVPPPSLPSAYSAAVPSKFSLLLQRAQKEPWRLSACTIPC